MYGIKTSKEAKAMLKDAEARLASFAQKGSNMVIDAVLEVEKWRGFADTLKSWEMNMLDVEEAASGLETGEEPWSPERILLTKYRVFARLAIRDTDDKWSGRGNDARRSFNDGRKEALDGIELELRYEEHGLYKAKQEA